MKYSCAVRQLSSCEIETTQVLSTGLTSPSIFSSAALRTSRSRSTTYPTCISPSLAFAALFLIAFDAYFYAEAKPRLVQCFLPAYEKETHRQLGAHNRSCIERSVIIVKSVWARKAGPSDPQVRARPLLSRSRSPISHCLPLIKLILISSP